jgi:guanylate kinase
VILCYIFGMSIFIATCGPTGIGKTYLMQRLIARDPRRFTPVLSVTTRARRDAEDGFWYRFITREELSSFDPADVLSNVEFRGEQYVLLRSEIAKAMERAPIAFMAIVTPVILLLRREGVPHALVSCTVGDEAGYEARLKKRGFDGEALQSEKRAGIEFVYPPEDPAWPQRRVALGIDATDEDRFTAAVRELAGPLFPAELR